MVGAHPGGGSFQGAALRRRDRAQRGVQLILRDLQCTDAGGLKAIEAARELEHGCVTPSAHIGHDVGDALFDQRVSLRRPMQHALELGIEVSRAGAELAHGDTHGVRPTAAANASIRPRSASRLSFNDAWFTTRRAEIGMMVSTSIR